MILLTLAMTATSAPGFGAQEVEFFEKKVRPILVERCYECHGEKKPAGGLRLDHREGVLKGGDRGAAFVAGDPEASLLIKSITPSDPEFQNPPKHKLPAGEIETLKEWIRLGVPDPRSESPASAKAAVVREPHWAYQPLNAPQVPVVQDATWPVDEIDRFILARLEAKGLRPNASADRVTLARRLHFALTGLPPEAKAIDQFVNDERPDALARLVDALLASPRFGERWGRHWLDVVRFGESVTLRGLVFTEAWRYRDYVIAAFNDDRPYDQFVREQIAGDLLGGQSVEERQRRLIATTFLALGNTNFEEQDKQQLEMDFIDEQLDTLGKAFLAQTIGCARCHDHKFDPIPTRDYYALAGILRNATAIEHANVSKWVEVPLPLEPAAEARLVAHEQTVARLTGELKLAKEQLNQQISADDQTTTPNVLLASALPGAVVDSATATRVGEWQLSQYSKRYIGDGYLHDQNSDKGRKTLTFQADLTTPGQYEVRLAYSAGDSRATNVPVAILHADGETTVFVNQRGVPPIDARFVSLGRFRFERGNQGYVLLSNEGTAGHVTGDAVQFLPVDAAPGGDVSTVADCGPAIDSTAVEAAKKRVAELETQLAAANREGAKRPMVMAIRENPTVGDIPIHVRGSVHNLGAVAPRGFLQVAGSGAPAVIGKGESGRRQLADWLARPDNPLTARVMVNRVWHWLFGAGLVRSTDNFGTTGDEPSHPELLDHLASRFIADGWSVKKLIRRIVLSQTYQLSTMVDADSAKSDPDNRLWWRMNRQRLDAECLRDAMLQIGGRLDLTVGGRTVAAGLSADYGVTYDGLRRSVYVPVLRNSLPEIFEVFDFADPSMVVGARNVSTVAPQALFMLNHPFVQAEARHAAKRLLAVEGIDSTARVRQAYRTVVGRPPQADELKVAEEFLAAPAALADPTESWANLIQALFASVDFRYVD